MFGKLRRKASPKEADEAAVVEPPAQEDDGAGRFHTGGVVPAKVEDPPQERAEADILADWSKLYQQGRDAALADLSRPDDPVQIEQDCETGMWLVRRPKLHIRPDSYMSIPEVRRYWHRMPAAMAYSREERALSEPPEAVRVEASYVWEAYEPRFVHFAEAVAWAQETVLLGKQPIRLGKDGLIASGAGSEVVACLLKAREERELLTKGAEERRETYAEEAMF